MDNNLNPIWAIVPASGLGRRMQSELPKQYLSFQGKTVIEHCLDRLLSHPGIEGAVVVLQDDDSHWEELGYTSEKPVLTTAGGVERHHSVYNGLLVLQDRCGSEVLALVHDAIRPLVTHGRSCPRSRGYIGSSGLGYPQTAGRHYGYYQDSIA